MVLTPLSFNDLQQCKDELEAKEHRYLRENGWEYTCNTPGSFWLWKKRIGDVYLLLEKNHAITMQRHLEHN